MQLACLRHLSLTLFLMLAACSALQPRPQPSSSVAVHEQHLADLANIRQFDIHGRIGVQTNPRGFSGSMQWQHALAGDQIQLFSPLGGQVAQISTTANGVVLVTSDGKSYQAADAETLTQQTLGWSLPMRGLADWVVGRPASGALKDASWDIMGRLTTLQQDGWDIEYADYINIDGHQLPTRISLRSPQLNLKLIVENWQLKPESGSTASTRAGGDS